MTARTLFRAPIANSEASTVANGVAATPRRRPATGASPGGPEIEQPLAFTKARLAQALGVSERHIQRLVAAGKIRTIPIGRAVRIPGEEVSRILREGASF